MSEQEEEKQYIKAFNDGYLMNKYQPELAAQLAKASSNSVQMAAFKNGREQFISERNKDHRPTWLRGELPSQERLDPDPDKDIELER